MELMGNLFRAYILDDHWVVYIIRRIFRKWSVRVTQFILYTLQLGCISGLRIGVLFLEFF